MKETKPEVKTKGENDTQKETKGSNNSSGSKKGSQSRVSQENDRPRGGHRGRGLRGNAEGGTRGYGT